jgi:hypothetical protein
LRGNVAGQAVPSGSNTGPEPRPDRGHPSRLAALDPGLPPEPLVVATEPPPPAPEAPVTAQEPPTPPAHKLRVQRPPKPVP